MPPIKARPPFDPLAQCHVLGQVKSAQGKLVRVYLLVFRADLLPALKARQAEIDKHYGAPCVLLNSVEKYLMLHPKDDREFLLNVEKETCLPGMPRLGFVVTRTKVPLEELLRDSHGQSD